MEKTIKKNLASISCFNHRFVGVVVVVVSKDELGLLEVHLAFTIDKVSKVPKSVKKCQKCQKISPDRSNPPLRS